VEMGWVIVCLYLFYIFMESKKKTEETRNSKTNLIAKITGIAGKLRKKSFRVKLSRKGGCVSGKTEEQRRKVANFQNMIEFLKASYL
jgi:hypothetical protein